MQDCNIVVSELDLQLCYYIHFQTNAPWEKYKPPQLCPFQLWVK